MNELLRKIQLFTKKHREITAAVLGLLVVVLFCSTIFGTLRTQAAADMDNPIDGISDDRSLVELDGLKETVAESFAGANDRAEENKEDQQESEEENKDNKDQENSKSENNTGDTSQDGSGGREGDEGNNEDNRGSNQGDKPKKDKNAGDDKNDEKEAYFRTSIVDGDTLTDREYEYTITHLTDLEVKTIQEKVNKGKFTQFDGKLNLDTGENTVVIKVTYIGKDGKSFDVQKSYTLYVNVTDVIIKSNLVQVEGTTVTEKVLNFEAKAECAGEDVELQVTLENKSGSQKVSYEPDGQYSVTLAEGKNTIHLHAEKGSRKADDSYALTYQIPIEKQFKVETNLAERNNQTVKSRAFEFDAYGFQGSTQVEVTVTWNGTEIEPTEPNQYAVILEDGANTFTITPHNGEERGDTQEYTITFQKKSDGDGGDDPDNPDRPIVSCPELESYHNGTVNNSPLSFTVYAQNCRGEDLPASQIRAVCNGVECDVLWPNDGEVSFSADLREGANTIYVEVDDGDGNVFKQNYSITYTPPEEEVTGTITLLVEATTIGIGYLVAPTQVEITRDQRLSEVLLEVLDANNYAPEYTGDVESDFYLAHIMDKDGRDFVLNPVVPEDLEAHLLEINEQSAEDVYPMRWYTNSLGEFDFCVGSGWMYSVDGVYPNYSMADCILQDGNEIRIRFTLYYGADIGGAGALGNGTNEDEAIGNWEREW